MSDLPVENVQSYPRPPVIQVVPDLVRIEFSGAVLVETDKALRVIETHHAPTYYIPPDEWAEGALRPARGKSYCEWKDTAHYWDVVWGDAVAERAAWSYPKPTPTFAAIRDHVAVYAGQMQACWVGDHRVRPQPGAFYGGWITTNLRGIVKGGPGTENW